MRYLERCCPASDRPPLEGSLPAWTTCGTVSACAGMEQKDPLIEYKREGFGMFSSMMERIKSDVLERMFRVQAVRGEQPPRRLLNDAAATWYSTAATNRPPKTVQSQADKTGRNDPCPAEAGKIQEVQGIG